MIPGLENHMATSTEINPVVSHMVELEYVSQIIHEPINIWY